MNFPNGVNLKDISLTIYSPSFYSESKSLIGHSRAIPASRFESTFKTVPLNPIKARELWGFINGLCGQLIPFSVVLPTYSNSLGNIVNNPKSKNNMSAGGKNFTVSNLPANVANLMIAGDVMKLAGHNKVYTLTKTLSSNSLGDAIIEFEPRLQQAIVANELVIVKQVPFSFRLRSEKSVISKKITDQGYVSFSFDCIEAL